MLNQIVITEGVRTPVGKYGGALRDFQSWELACLVVKEVLDRSGLPPEAIDGVILGCCGQFSKNQWAARIAALKSGLPDESTALMVNRQCAAGLQAIITAAQTIANGDADLIIAGGCEDMSSYPYLVPQARWGYRMGNAPLVDQLVANLTDPFHDIHFGVTAENVARKYGITREAQDAWAVQSHERARAAQEQGLFDSQLLPITVGKGKHAHLFARDEGPRKSSLEDLAKLPPSFVEGGTVTAGNAGSINDAAAAVLVMHEKKAEELGCKPLLRLVDYAVAGVAPEIMGIGPIASTRKLMAKVGMNLDEVGIVELNEAFAAQALACIQELGLNPEIVNVNGSGISLGHPVGATGCILTIKLAYEMRRRNIRYGLATMCIGGGQGMSALFELI